MKVRLGYIITLSQKTQRAGIAPAGIAPTSSPGECLPSMQKPVGLVPRLNHNSGSKNNKQM